MADRVSQLRKVTGMKRWLIHLTIVTYLGALGFGIFAHTVNVATGSHPVMYFLVWDMFCGWAAYETRFHVIGEGASGKYYELAPGPWGELRPFGRIGRRHYDAFGRFSIRLAQNTLRNAEHEPMGRVFVIEEHWPKKYNFPDHVWKLRYDEPKDKHSYYHVRHIYSPDGVLTHTSMSWLNWQSGLSVSANPRLLAESRRGRTFMAVNGVQRAQDSPGGAVVSAHAIGSPLGN